MFIIILFKSITTLCNIDIIPWNISRYSYIETKCEKYLELFCGILSIPHNIVMELKNIMIFPFFCVC